MLATAISNNGLQLYRVLSLQYITIKFRVKMPKHFSHLTDTLKFAVKIKYGKDAKNKMRY